MHYDYPPATLLWSTGETTPTITVQPGSTTSYSCVGTVIGASTCTVEDTITVQVNSNPVVPLGNDTSICMNSSITLDAGNTGSSFLWCSSATTQTIIAGMAGSYCVNVTDANGCSGGDTINIMMNPLPALTASGDTICNGSNGNLSASGSATNYLWNPGAFSGAAVSDNPSSTTTYTVTATDVTGCSSIDSAIILVNSNPSVQTAGDVICLNSSATIAAAGTATSYLWQPGNLSTDSISVSPSSNSTYTVTATDSNGCTTVDSATVTVNALPSLSVTGDTVCSGSSGTLNASGSGTTYLWNPGSLTGNTIVDSPSATTTYTVNSTDANNCTSTSTVTLVVNLLPVVSVSSFGTHCFNDGAFTLTGGTPAGGTYSGTAVNAGNFTPSLAGNGTHSISYSYTDANGCSSTDSGNVIINPCTGIISNAIETGVMIYPNPFHESAVLSIDQNRVLENGIFTLYDITGKVVMKMTNVTSTTISINRNTLENGVYFYTFTDNGVVIGSGKLVVN